MASNAGKFNLEDYIIHHVSNSTEWHLPFIGTIHLPEWLTLHGLMIVLASFILLFVFCGLYKKDDQVPSGLTNALEAVIVFIRDQIAIPSMGNDDGRHFTPLFCTQFFFILLLNLMGAIPLFSTATGNVNVTAALAIVSLTVMIFGTILKNGVKGFFSALMPSGVPWPVLLILAPIEFVGLFIKAFALTIRLFANMMAGHIVIFSLIGLVGLLGYVAVPSVLMAIFISLMEVFIAFLQAYIFTLLSAIFIGQMLHPEH